MARYRYNDIIIATNVLLGLLPAGFYTSKRSATIFPFFNKN